MNITTPTISTPTTPTYYMMKSKFLYHSFSIPNFQHKTKLPSFNFPPYSPFNATTTNIISAKNKYWVIKSHNKDQVDEITVDYVSKINHTNELNNCLHLHLQLKVVLGVGLVLFLMGQEKAWALGPEGPLVEEFWENVRRYALYALTVSTGVIYTVFQPILELLKNPFSAFLILVIIGGSFFIVSQILSAMVGVSDFSYQYAY